MVPPTLVASAAWGNQLIQSWTVADRGQQMDREFWGVLVETGQRGKPKMLLRKESKTMRKLLKLEEKEKFRRSKV